MKTKSYKTEPIKENPHGVDVRTLYDEPSAQVMHITLKPGESLKPHKTPLSKVRPTFFTILAMKVRNR